MKKLMILSLMFYLPTTFAEQSITALDMELGHWVIKTEVDQSAIIEQALASVPEEQKALMEQIIKKQIQNIKDVDQCITQETLDNFDQQIKNSFGQGGQAKDCEFDAVESTNKKFVGTLTCSGQVMNITTIATSTKRNESTIVGNVPGVGKQTITSVGEWKSSTCPAGL